MHKPPEEELDSNRPCSQAHVTQNKDYHPAIYYKKDRTRWYASVLEERKGEEDQKGSARRLWTLEVASRRSCRWARVLWD